MAQKQCEECKKVFEYNPPVNFPDKRKYCDECSARKKAQYENRNVAQNNPPQAQIVAPSTSNAVIGVEHGISKVEHIFQNSYEFGPAGNRHSIKYYTIEELKAKMKELEDEGYLIEHKNI
jgi:16S rRNA U1498 N3-methylase RsmE